MSSLKQYLFAPPRHNKGWWAAFEVQDNVHTGLTGTQHLTHHSSQSQAWDTSFKCRAHSSCLETPAEQNKTDNNDDAGGQMGAKTAPAVPEVVVQERPIHSSQDSDYNQPTADCSNDDASNITLGEMAAGGWWGWNTRRRNLTIHIDVSKGVAKHYTCILRITTAAPSESLLLKLMSHSRNTILLHAL